MLSTGGRARARQIIFVRAACGQRTAPRLLGQSTAATDETTIRAALRESHTGMNVLLISHPFPPFPVSGALRAAKVARALQARGHNVVVVTSRLPGEPRRLRVDEPGLRVQPVTTIPHPRHLYVFAKTHLRRNGPAVPGGNRGEDVGTRVPTWKRHLLSLLLVPDDLQGFIAPAVVRSLKYIREGVDLIYTTAPPASTHLAGLLLKQMTGIRWAMEFRDPWTDNPGRSTQMQSRASNAIEHWLEQRCLDTADQVIAVSDGIHDLLTPKLQCGDRLLVVRNGISELRETLVATERGAPFRIVYLGNFYMGRDPRPFLEAVAALRARRDLVPGQIVVELIGKCRWYNSISVEQMVSDLGLEEMVRFHGWIPHEEGQRFLGQADLLLLSAQDQPTQVPNKLYEYLGMRKPILALADPEGETARMLRQVGGHRVVTDHADPEAIHEALDAAFVAWMEGRPQSPTGDEEVLRDWTTECQMDRLLLALGA